MVERCARWFPARRIRARKEPLNQEETRKMAAVPIIINGVLMPKAKGGADKPVPAVFIGYASIAGLEVGGGPVIPDNPPEVPTEPPTEEPPPGPGIAVVIKPAP